MTELLVAKNLSAGYDGHPVARNLDITVRAGEIVALLGANGAGKTTTLRTLAGDLPAVAGDVCLAGRPTRAPLHRRTRAGVAFVTEERSVFMQLSVADNLRVGRCKPDRVLALFPELKSMLARPAGSLSGGEQQMLTLGRALARDPRILLADELSLGLAPMVVGRLLDAVRAAADEEGLGALLVEQHINEALRVADTAYVMRRGEIVLSGPAGEIIRRLPEIEELYM